MLASSFRMPWRLAVLVLCVTGLHLWLLDAPWRPQGLAAPASAEPARMTLVAPRAPVPAAAPAPLLPVPVLPDRPEPSALPELPPAAQPAAGPAAPPADRPAAAQAAPQPEARPEPAAAVPARPAVQLPVQVGPGAVAGEPMAALTEPATTALASASASASAPAGPVAAASAPAAIAEAPPEGQPLALPATQVRSEPAEWRYRAERGAAVGEAVLRWGVAEAGYELALQASVGGRSLLDWQSRGSLTAQGLQPLRMVERQREREVQAVNFQRDKGLISFSGPSRTAPLLPGAQDRLSWIVQLAAVSRARGGLQPGEVLRLQVAGPRGDVDEWRFTVQPVDERLLNGRRVGLTHLLREPQRPYDLRVQLWLAPSMDHLPVGLSWGVEPAGQPLILWMTSLPLNV